LLLDRPHRLVSTRRVSQIHFIGGEKGGVGKSVVARLLAQYWIDRGRAFAGVDGDSSHGALVRHYGDFSHFVDLSQNDSADQILDRALGADRRVLVDLPAQSAKSLDAWLTGANVLGLARELGTPITFWHVSDGGFASVGQLDKALDRYTDRVGHIVVRNHARSKDFSQLEASPAMGKLAALSGSVVDLPELDLPRRRQGVGGGDRQQEGLTEERDLGQPPLPRRQADDGGVQRPLAEHLEQSLGQRLGQHQLEPGIALPQQGQEPGRVIGPDRGHEAEPESSLQHRLAPDRPADLRDLLQR
jgi:hypothetical protein